MRWIGIPSQPGQRARLLHFLGIGVTLSAAKVVLNTLAAVLFFAREGPDQLPMFYVAFTAIALVVSAAFAAVVDALPPSTLVRNTALAAAAVAAILWPLVAWDTPTVYFLLLAGANIYEIISDIVFWVVATSCFTSREMKRHGTSFLLALAAGGAAGGVLTNGLLALLTPADLLFGFVMLALGVAAQAWFARDRLVPIDSDQEADDEGLLSSLRAFPGMVARYPYVLLLACNSLLMMTLYCLSEYLWATAYVAAFDDERELASFVAKVFVVTQVLEFALLVLVGHSLLEKAGPTVRNLVFPLTSLGCLIAFALGSRLPAAVALHLNGEAVSNALFEPAKSANFIALPQRFHGRARTLVDGIFYPAGMAAAGLALAWSVDATSMTAVVFMALTVALLFFALNVVLGALFLPTLVRSLRSGIVHFAEVGAKLQPLRLASTEVSRLIRGGDVATRSVGLTALRQRRDLTPLVDDLLTLAVRADRETRNQLVDLLRATPAAIARQIWRPLLDGEDRGGQLLALQFLLCRYDQVATERLGELARASPAITAMLARLALAGSDPDVIARVDSELRDAGRVDPDDRSALIDAIATADRAELTPLLQVAIVGAPAEDILRALVALARVAPHDAAAAATARRFVRHRDHRIRAAALSAVGDFAPEAANIRALERGLQDPTTWVRRAATEALAGLGEGAIEIAAARLSDPDLRVVKGAVQTLGKIGSRRARGELEAFLQDRCTQGVRHLSWLGQLSRKPQDRALRFILGEDNRRTLDLALEALAALGHGRVVQDVRHALRSQSLRRRADAVETLLALPDRRLVTMLLPLLEAFGQTDDSQAGDGASGGAADPRAEAARDRDPWIRAAARMAAPKEYQTTDIYGVATRAPTGETGAVARGTDEVTEAQVERVLFLRSIPLFRNLPLDTLRAVAAVLQPRHYGAEQVILAARSVSSDLHVVERGAVAFRDGDREVERLVAPTVFGEQALVDDVVWSRAVVAIEPTDLLIMPRTVFADIAAECPEIVVELSRLLARPREDQTPEADTPSIAVLPFDNMSGDPEQEYFADGIAEDIITLLSKNRSFLVISRDSSFAFKGRTRDPKEVAQTLGVRYVLAGSVRRAGVRVRITAQLVDATAGYQVWTDRYDREFGDIFAVQDEITASIVSAIAPEFLWAETRRAQRKDLRDLNTWELVMRARWHHARCTQSDLVEAHGLLGKALTLDPLNVGGYCLQALTHLAEIQFGWTDSRKASLAAAAKSARSAIQQDTREALAHAALGLVDLMSRRYDDAIGRFERAVGLNPNLAMAQGGLGQAKALSGDYQPAVTQIQEAIRLSPEDPLIVYWYGHLGLAAFAVGRFEEAAEWGVKAANQNPDSPAGHRLLAASLAQSGRIEEARAAFAEVLRRMPNITAADVPEQVPFKHQEHIQLYIDGLREAGLTG